MTLLKWILLSILLKTTFWEYSKVQGGGTTAYSHRPHPALKMPTVQPLPPDYFYGVDDYYPEDDNSPFAAFHGGPAKKADYHDREHKRFLGSARQHGKRRQLNGKNHKTAHVNRKSKRVITKRNSRYYDSSVEKRRELPWYIRFFDSPTGHGRGGYKRSPSSENGLEELYSYFDKRDNMRLYGKRRSGSGWQRPDEPLGIASKRASAPIAASWRQGSTGWGSNWRHGPKIKRHLGATRRHLVDFVPAPQLPKNLLIT